MRYKLVFALIADGKTPEGLAELTRLGADGRPALDLQQTEFELTEEQVDALVGSYPLGVEPQAHLDYALNASMTDRQAGRFAAELIHAEGVVVSTWLRRQIVEAQRAVA